MSFGIRDPFKYAKPGRRVVHPESYDSCPVCSKVLKATTDGLIPVAPCLIPLVDSDVCDLLIIFACSSCYVAQKRLNCFSIEDLKEYRTKGNRKQIDAPKKAAGRPRKSAASLSKDDLKTLQQAFDLIGSILRGHGAKIETFGRCDTEESDMSRRAMNQDLPEDDIEFGMTEDQKRRMDKAVNDSSERTKLVPSEAWNGKTAAEILKLDKNGLPDGW